MNSLIKDLEKLQFDKYFSSEEKCLEYLASEKWINGFICRKCGHSNYCKGKKPFSRRCTKCKIEESATAHTIFHKCKFPLTEAFKITYIVCHNRDISTFRLSEELDLRQMTCWKFKKKIAECIDKRGDLNIVDKEILKKSIIG
jgi:two-component system, sensor histidine kinase LadS